jgi:ribosomal-protein-alanine N-acetyltransferase
MNRYPLQLLIETHALALRRFVPGDARKMFLMSQEEGMRTWLPSQVYRDATHAASVLDYLIAQYDLDAGPTSKPIVLGIEHKATRGLIGHVGLSPIFETVEVGFGIKRSEHRKGYATEAVSAMCAWAMQQFDLPAILGITATENIASQGVLLRSGFYQKEKRVMRFQGVEKPVLIFEYSD